MPVPNILSLCMFSVLENFHLSVSLDFHLLMQSFFIRRRPLSLRASSLNLTNYQIIITYDTEDLTWQFTSILCPVAFRQAYVSLETDLVEVR